MLVAAGVITLTIGSIDAGISGEWDLFVLFVVGLGLNVTLLLRLQSRRPAVPIRHDLVAWLRDRASVSGESLKSVGGSIGSGMVDAKFSRCRRC